MNKLYQIAAAGLLATVSAFAEQDYTSLPAQNSVISASLDPNDSVQGKLKESIEEKLGARVTQLRLRQLPNAPNDYLCDLTLTGDSTVLPVAVHDGKHTYYFSSQIQNNIEQLWEAINKDLTHTVFFDRGIESYHKLVQKEHIPILEMDTFVKEQMVLGKPGKYFQQCIDHEHQHHKDLETGIVDQEITKIKAGETPENIEYLNAHAIEFKQGLFEERAYLRELLEGETEFLTLGKIIYATLPIPYRQPTNFDIDHLNGCKRIKHYFDQQLETDGKGPWNYDQLTRQEIRKVAVTFAEKYHPDLIHK